VLVTMCER
ncbi:hypothetical protein KGM_202804B, partial [Danaus plexippus plexippus]